MKLKDNIIRYLEETKVELQKVTWPTKPEVIGSTIVVIVTSIVISAFIFLVDRGLSEIVSLILS
jgi:preprotein translocase subunit SecE